MSPQGRPKGESRRAQHEGTPVDTTTRAPSVGTAHPRRDGAMKVTGTAPYAYDPPVPNAVHLFPLLAPVARGKVLHIDATAALALPGVLLVLTHDNAPRLWQIGRASCRERV